MYMTVQELITKLSELPPDALIGVCIKDIGADIATGIEPHILARHKSRINKGPYKGYKGLYSEFEVPDWKNMADCYEDSDDILLAFIIV